MTVPVSGGTDRPTVRAVREWPRKQVTTVTTTTVEHVARPYGRARNNPLSLAQLREFVEACDGLDGDLSVSIQNGSLDEGGRHDTTLRVTLRETIGADRPDPS